MQGSRRSAARPQLSHPHTPGARACLVCLVSWTVPADGEAAAAPTRRRCTRWGWLIGRNSERYSPNCPCPAPCHSTIANIPPAMSPGGPGNLQAPSAFYSFSPLMDSLSNGLAGNIHQKGSRLPTIQPASPPTKGAPHASTPPNRPAFFPVPRGNPHATFTASSGSSTTESFSEVTSSSSSRDSLPTPQGRNGPTTPQKQARNNRRKQSNKSSGRWSRGGGSSDDTGSDRKPPTSQPAAESAQSAAPSPQSASKTRQHSHIATHSPSTNQTRFMATAFGGPSGDSRRGVVSPRPKGRGRTQPTHAYSRTESDWSTQKRRTLSAAMSPFMGTAGTRTVSARDRICRMLVVTRFSMSLYPRQPQIEPE